MSNDDSSVTARSKKQLLSTCDPRLGTPTAIFAISMIRHTILDYLPLASNNLASFVLFGSENYLSIRGCKLSKMDILKIDQKRKSLQHSKSLSIFVKICAGFRALFGNDLLQQLLQSEWKAKFTLSVATEQWFIEINDMLHVQPPSFPKLHQLFDQPTQTFLQKFLVNMSKDSGPLFRDGIIFRNSHILINSTCTLAVDSQGRLYLSDCLIKSRKSVVLHTKDLLPCLGTVNVDWTSAADAEVFLDHSTDANLYWVNVLAPKHCQIRLHAVSHSRKFLHLRNLRLSTACSTQFFSKLCSFAIG